MKISITFGTSVLALAATATSCASFTSGPAPTDKVYLVGVAGGG